LTAVVRGLLKRIRELVARILRWALTTFAELIERLAQVGLIQSGIVLAAQTFLALFPLLMALIAVLPAPTAHHLADSLRTRLGLGGESEQMLEHLIASQSQLRAGTTAVGALVVLASATSFTRALQRVYENSWQLPRTGLRGTVRGLGWLLGLIVYLGLLGVALRLSGSGATGTLTRTVVGIVASVALWWWTPFVLVSGRVRARALLPTGVLTAAAVLILGRVSTVVVPRTVASNERLYGTIGTVFAIESWLVIVACTLVACAVVGAVAAQASGPIGVLARGGSDPDGWHREARRLRRRKAHGPGRDIRHGAGVTTDSDVDASPPPPSQV
jgi:membrane protein